MVLAAAPAFVIEVISTFTTESDMRLLMRLTLLVWVGLGASSCFAYHEIPSESITPGQLVRVTVDRESALEIAATTGDLRTQFSGIVAGQTTESTLALSYEVSGSDFREFAAFSRSGVVRVEERRLSATRSIGAAALTGLVAALILSVTEGGDDANPGEGPPTNEQIRIPLIRLGF